MLVDEGKRYSVAERHNELLAINQNLYDCRLPRLYHRYKHKLHYRFNHYHRRLMLIDEGTVTLWRNNL